MASTLAGFAAQHLKEWSFEVAGWTFVGYHLIFAFSLVPRALCAFWLGPKLEEEDATPTREAVVEVGTNLAQAFNTRFSRLFEARAD